jgi:hypothetical protein
MYARFDLSGFVGVLLGLDSKNICTIPSEYAYPSEMSRFLGPIMEGDSN